MKINSSGEVALIRMRDPHVSNYNSSSKFRFSGSDAATQRGGRARKATIRMRFHRCLYMRARRLCSAGDRARLAGGHSWGTSPAPPTTPCMQLAQPIRQGRVPSRTARHAGKHHTCALLTAQRPLHLCPHATNRSAPFSGTNEVARPPLEQPPLLLSEARRQGTG